MAITITDDETIKRMLFDWGGSTPIGKAVIVNINIEPDEGVMIIEFEGARGWLSIDLSRGKLSVHIYATDEGPACHAFELDANGRLVPVRDSASPPDA